MEGGEAGKDEYNQSYVVINNNDFVNKIGTVDIISNEALKGRDKKDEEATKIVLIADITNKKVLRAIEVKTKDITLLPESLEDVQKEEREGLKWKKERPPKEGEKAPINLNEQIHINNHGCSGMKDLKEVYARMAGTEGKVVGYVGPNVYTNEWLYVLHLDNGSIIHYPARAVKPGKAGQTPKQAGPEQARQS